MSRRLVATEHQEQAAFFQWLQARHRDAYDLAAAVPNGAHKSKAARGVFKAEGLKAGYPDILIDLPAGPYHGLRIEMKRRSRSLSRASEAQLEWIHRLRLRGYYATVCYGCDEAIETVEFYVALGPFQQGEGTCESSR